MAFLGVRGTGTQHPATSNQHPAPTFSFRLLLLFSYRLFMMNGNEKIKIFEQLSWDYNISPGELEAVLKGEKKRAGHFTRETIFIRLLETYPWFTIIQLMEVTDIMELLTDKLISHLRSPSLRIKYEFIRERLSQVIQASG